MGDEQNHVKREGSVSPSTFRPANANNNNNPHGSPSGARPSTSLEPEGQSVVSKLMRIYESMTQSSTPQNPNNEDLSSSVDESQHQQQHELHAHQQQHALMMSDHDMSYSYADPAAFAFLPPDHNFYPGFVPPPQTTISTNSPAAVYHSGDHHHHHHPRQGGDENHAFSQSATTTTSPEVPESSETIMSSSTTTTAATNTRSLRKRSLEKTTSTSSAAAAASSDTSINSSSGAGGGRGSKSNSRKKAKETDNRWSKRFTWPDDLHRDFVSAIFDVGLKHSSPSAILEHMPTSHKHNEQITSERIKSHLQKYRLHRNKSKKEFMASYDAAFSKFRAGLLNANPAAAGAAARPFASGEVGAHLSYSIITEGENENAPGTGDTTSQDGQQQQQQQQDEEQQAEGQQKQQQQQQQDGAQDGSPGPNGPDRPNTGLPATTATSNSASNNNEALMLPQLSEHEKRSPIGVSMGYLMGLFFSLKEQLMAQRAAAAAAATAAAAAAASAGSNSNSNTIMPSVNAVYDAFVQGDTATAAASAPGAATNSGWMNVSDVSQQLVSFASQAAHLDGSNIGMAAPAAVTPGTTTTLRSNLEESTFMKREMQHQMAFQNKMRALKQHELEKYQSNNANMPITNITFDNSDPNKGTGGGDDQQHQYKSDDDAGMPSSSVGAGGATGMSGEMGHPDSQGAGENAMDPSMLGGNGGQQQQQQQQRNRGLSLGASDEFWTSDVVDEQLFEFLMNN